MFTNINISNYKPFYIQIEDATGAYDTREQWGLIAKTNPYFALPQPKTPYANDFKGEHGTDEYVSAMTYESFEYEVQFYIKTTDLYNTQGVLVKEAPIVLREAMQSFFNAIKVGEFAIYDSYTGLGRQGVRYAGYKEESFKARGNWARLIFSVTFKVNDPITFCRLNDDGQIVPIV